MIVACGLSVRLDARGGAGSVGRSGILPGGVREEPTNFSPAPKGRNQRKIRSTAGDGRATGRRAGFVHRTTAGTLIVPDWYAGVDDALMLISRRPVISARIAGSAA